MTVDLEKIDLTRPDPNFKSDPKSRGDFVEDADDEALQAAEKAAADKVAADKAAADKAAADKKAAKPDEEEEEEDLEEEDDDEEEEEEEDDKKNDNRVPLSRMMKAKAKADQALARVRELEEQLKTATAKQSVDARKDFDEAVERIDTLYEEIEKARAAGEYKDAARLQKELDGLRSQMTRQETLMLSRRTALAEQQLSLYNSTLQQLEVAFPQLSEDHDDFDEELVADLDEMIRGLEKLGVPLSQALQKASRRILRYDPFARGDAAYLDGPPKKAGEEKKPEKRKTDVKKNAEASNRQAPDPKDSSADIQTKIDPKKISTTEYAALPEEVRRRMRGDSVTRS